MKNLIVSLLCLLGATSLSAKEEPAKAIPITKQLKSVDVSHGKANVKLDRRSREHGVNCPPACIQPMYPFGAAGVETVGELELIEYLRRKEQGEPILLVDSRAPQRAAKGVIPGAVNIPHSELRDSDPMAVADILEHRFGAVQIDGLWDFRDAKTLLLYCDGIVCARSVKAILSLLKYGYPAHKLKYYRGGFRSWKSQGLRVVTFEE